jgi:2-dehydro-3-deoxy-D-arabinonate dehydratase
MSSKAGRHWIPEVAMQLGKVQLKTGDIRVGVPSGDQVYLLAVEKVAGIRSLSDVLHAANPRDLIQDLLNSSSQVTPLAEVTLLAPIDQQEVWAAGVTYKRSREARERESVGAARFYDLVYTADRPELFFKATPHRVAGPGGAVRIRRDSRWSVPEPELALVLSPRLDLVGYTIGNDMSARDIEGENPLYLPQAKVYDQSCALGPLITLADSLPPPDRVHIRLRIERRGTPVFDGSTSLSAMARTFADLIAWLGRDNRFPAGVVLLTGTGIVPPDDFTLADGDVVAIEVTGIGSLVNRVEHPPGN